MTLVASPVPGVVVATLNVRLRIDLSGVTGVSPAGATVSAVLGWIEDLASKGITGGCGGGKYCHGDAVTQGQMAAFLSKTFKLSL